MDIAIDSQLGFVYVAEFENSRVQKFDIDGKFLQSWSVLYPSGLDVGPDSTVYVTDGAYYVRRYTEQGGAIGSWGGQGSGDGEFIQPVGITTNSKGIVYVADRGNARIQSFSPDGKFLDSWGGSSASGGFDVPYRLAVDLRGDIFVTDIENHLVVKTDDTGAVRGSKGGFNFPRGVEFYRSASVSVIYVADTNNDQIIALNANTNAELFRFGRRGTGDGELKIPYNVAVYTLPR